MPKPVVVALCVFAFASVLACGTRDTTVGFRTSGSQPCGNALTLATGSKVSLSHAQQLENARVAVVAGLNEDRVYFETDEAGRILEGPKRMGNAVALNTPSLAKSASRMTTSFSNHVLRGRWIVMAQEFDPANPSLDLAGAVEISKDDLGENLGPHLAAGGAGVGIAYRHVQSIEFAVTGADLKPLGHGNLSACSGLPKAHKVLYLPPDLFGVLSECNNVQALDVFSAVDGSHVQRRFGRADAAVATLSFNGQGSVVTWASKNRPQATMEQVDSLGFAMAETQKTFDLAVSAVQIAVAHSTTGDGILYVGSDQSLRFSLFPADPLATRTDQILGAMDVKSVPALLSTASGFLAIWAQQDGLALRAQALCPQ